MIIFLYYNTLFFFYDSTHVTLLIKWPSTSELETRNVNCYEKGKIQEFSDEFLSQNW